MNPGSCNVTPFLVLNEVAWDTPMRAAIFQKVIDIWSDYGFCPDKIGGDGAGLTKRYTAYARHRSRLSKSTFEKVPKVSMVKLKKDFRIEATDWIATASFCDNERWRQFFAGIIPVEVGDTLSGCVEKLKSMTEVLTTSYGYVFLQEKRMEPGMYALGMGWGPLRNERHSDARMNISWWGHTVSGECNTYKAGMLRDVYPFNFLSPPYLDAPVGRASVCFKDWIAEDPDVRGTLSPCGDDLWLWEPPIDQIPRLREDLYRAGRLFYWRFFDPSDPLFRKDIGCDWEAEGEIPEIYRESYYSGREPGLTY